MTEQEDRNWQRLDKWMWCARFMKARSDCARLIAEGSVRINGQPTEKPHARLRPGDVVTLPLRGDVTVVRVLALAARRGPATEARGLYEAIEGAGGLHEAANDCICAAPASGGTRSMR